MFNTILNEYFLCIAKNKYVGTLLFYLKNFVLSCIGPIENSYLCIDSA